MKFTLNWQHVGFFFLVGLTSLVNVYEHSTFFGNPSPTPATALTWIALAGSIVSTVGSLLVRSPQDVWRILQGELIELTGGNGSNGTPTIPGPPPTTIPPPPMNPPAAARTFMAVSPLTWQIAFKGALFAFACGIITTVLCCTPTPAKVATALSLADQAACVFDKLDENEPIAQVVVDCGVTTGDIFALESLFQRRARAKNLCMPVDAGP